MDRIEWSDFEQVELRAGTILSAEAFPEARLQTGRRFRSGDRAQEIERADHGPLRGRRTGRQTGHRRGQFSAQADRSFHVGMPGDRIPSRRRQGRARNRRQCGTEWSETGVNNRIRVQRSVQLAFVGLEASLQPLQLVSQRKHLLPHAVDGVTNLHQFRLGKRIERTRTGSGQ